MNNLSHVRGDYVNLHGETYYRIQHSHHLPEFFMSLVGPDDHWMFISSHGSLTAGRRNPDFALFPYLTDDQISATHGITGPLTLIRSCAANNSKPSIWNPFGKDLTPADEVDHNLYKSPLGNKIVFEEINATRRLVFRYRWAFSPRFGFVRDCWLENQSAETQRLEILDGLQNILPHGVGSEFVMRFSNLANAYKKSELVQPTNMGLFYLSSIPTDRAEPSEGLRSTVVWHSGSKPTTILLSTKQVADFLRHRSLQTETEIRGFAGAYLTLQTCELAPGATLRWQMVADLGKDQTDVVALADWLQANKGHQDHVQADIQNGEQTLRRIIGAADALQCGEKRSRTDRHFSNTLFNVMRGGVPLQNYMVERTDFVATVAKFNRDVYQRNQNVLDRLPEQLSKSELESTLRAGGDPDLIRLGSEYLPLAFSRRHGDPTRPWNRFSIDLRSPDGRTNLNYQGNWRDIFQNWEALGHSFPEFFPAMICRFVNATTADGYNAYRITKNGLEWEEPEPDNPWANIGYWNDHQIIYLLKLLEWNHRFYPGPSRELLSEAIFVHANVPYRIKPFAEIRQNPRDTIVFDHHLAREISQRVGQVGSDGKLLRSRANEIQHVTFVEKLLTLSLAKLTNFVPDGGIWLNTQRPEWNDANNALVGNGLSMVTTCYLHRWFKFLHEWLGEGSSEYRISSEVAEQFRQVSTVLQRYARQDAGPLDDATRLEILEALSLVGSNYREQLYDTGLSGATEVVSRDDLRELFRAARDTMAQTIRHNRRVDALYHAYNLLSWKSRGVAIETLDEMLEGQVAVLSSGVLSAREVVELLDSLRQSALYREDQDSYLLYPNRQLPTFLEKNQVRPEVVAAHPLLEALLTDGESSIVRRDVRGGVHFHGDFRNSADLAKAIKALGAKYAELVRTDGPQVVTAFEEIFGHRKFTGRSGTFFAYEGLGSIYWHMVSKLGLAVSENVLWAMEAGETPEVIARLKQHLIDIRRGIGAEKSPINYGAFPSDPYSHTPENAGVKQPGMTGQVKEDVLARFAEIGVDVVEGRLGFRLDLFDRDELLTAPKSFSYFDLAGNACEVEVPAHGFAFSLFQVPVIYQPGTVDQLVLIRADGTREVVAGSRLNEVVSRELYLRSGAYSRIECHWAGLQRAAK